MQENLEIKELNAEDIKFLNREMKKGYIILFFLSLFSIVLPGYLIYRIFNKPDSEDNGFALLMIILVFGFWTFLTIKAIIKTREEKQSLLLQKKIEGNVKVLKKEAITNEGYESDTISHEITIYSPVEEKYRNISLYKKDYERIKIGDFLGITYFTKNTSIKTLNFQDQNLKYKSFARVKSFEEFEKIIKK